MTEDEQRFWDAAFVALVAANEGIEDHLVRSIEACAGIADRMLAERRARIQTTSASA
jgi:hypothetical protein